MWLAFLDFSKAFHVLDRGWLKEKLYLTLGSGNRFCWFLINLLQYNDVKISDSLSLSDLIRQTNGILQGDPFSPLLYNLAASDMIQEAKGDDTEVSILAYADDIAIVASDIKPLQATVNRMTN